MANSSNHDLRIPMTHAPQPVVGVCDVELVCYSLKYGNLSLVPRPCPAFHHSQCVKAGRAWYLFSCKHDRMDKRQKKSEWKSDVLLNLQQVQGLVYKI